MPINARIYIDPLDAMRQQSGYKKLISQERYQLDDCSGSLVT